MNNSTPVFIGGVGRSGTTLVADMLGSHQNLSPIYETGFILEVMRLLFGKPALPIEAVCNGVNQLMDEWTKTLPHRPHNKRDHEQFHHGAHHVLFDRPFAMAQTEQLLAEVIKGQAPIGLHTFICNLFEEHCRRDGKPRWVNKTPNYVRQLLLLRNLFPDLRFIHCVRDGRDVACSVLTRPWGPKTVSEAAAWWIEYATAGVRFAQEYPTQCMEVRYEDLLRDPTAQLGRMLDWLGEENCSAEIVHRYQQGPVSLDKSRMGGWKMELSAADISAFQEQAGELLAYFHYE